MSVPTQIQRLLDARQLQEVRAPDEDVALLWEKAVASARDARNASLSVDGRYALGYLALLQMATAVLAAAGYRTRGAQGHHAATFYAVSVLDIDGLESLGQRTDALRATRAQSAYGTLSPAPGELDVLLRLLRTTLPVARAWLLAARPRVRLAELGEGGG